MQLILVSACLLGEAVRYGGADRLCDHPILRQWLAERGVISVCPEVIGGLPVPRPAAEISGQEGSSGVLSGVAKVIDADGNDLSAPFVEGAKRVLEQAHAKKIRIAVLKEGSPSCETHFVYDGRFGRTRLAALVVTAALLRQSGIEVFSEQQFEAANEWFLRLKNTI